MQFRIHVTLLGRVVEYISVPAYFLYRPEGSWHHPLNTVLLMYFVFYCWFLCLVLRDAIQSAPRSNRQFRSGVGSSNYKYVEITSIRCINITEVLYELQVTLFMFQVKTGSDIKSRATAPILM